MTNENTQNKVIILSGPTAVGKTALTIRLAQALGTSVISADSRQAYKMLTIGTAKPNQEELKSVPHYLIDYLDISEPLSAGSWARQAKSIIDNASSAPIVSGGTTFYIKALCEGLDKFPAVPASIVEDLNEKLRKHGIEALQLELQELDPMYFEQVDQYNSHRLIRALSVIRSSGNTFSSYQNTASKNPNLDALYILLERERAELYDRINKRVDLMIQQGLIDEARILYPNRALQALQTVGYQELFSYFDGHIDLNEAIRLIKRNSRRYAKRQLTWFRNDQKWHRFHPGDYDDIYSLIKKFLDIKYDN